MSDLQYFQQFQHESHNQLATLRPTKVQIFGDEQLSENYTLVARPDDHTLLEVKKLYEELKAIEPNQFYYPLENLHLTILGNLPINIPLEKIIQAVKQILPQYQLLFDLSGVNSNQYCASISAYPKAFSMHQLRSSLREVIGQHGDDYSDILASYEYMGWINFLRYLQPPSQTFLGTLRSLQNQPAKFGTLAPHKIQICKNTSKVLDPKHSQLVFERNM